MQQLTNDQIAQFARDGYLVAPQLFDAEEMDLLLKIGRADRELASEASGRRDGAGGVTKYALRGDLTETIYSAIVRCRRIVDPMEKLLGDEIYHYHHKMMLKEPRVGGAWEWHQDYAYWYDNGCLFPDMGSCMIAVDRAAKANGCLQIIPGSHRCGRIEHGKAGEQAGAAQERVDALIKRFGIIHCEMEPGSALFFHGNLLHRSDQNRSEHPRWSLICCYNTKHNDPIKPGGAYKPLERWPDSRVKECGRKQWSAIEQAMASAPTA
jgi:hypothetical protein